MAQVIGTRTTSQAISETRLVRDVANTIAEVQPNVAPSITLLLKLNKRTACYSPRIEWFEDDFVSHWTTNGADTVGASTSSTTVTVTDGTLFVPGDIFGIPKAVTSSAAMELCRVVSRTTNTLTVVRDIGGVGAAAINAGVTLFILSRAYEENGAMPTAKTMAPVAKMSYTQIFRVPLSISRTTMASRQYGAQNGERDRLHEKEMKEFKIQLNKALLFGQKGEDLTGGPTGYPIRYTDGVNNVISTNVTDAGGLLTMNTFNSFAASAFRYGNTKQKLLITAPIVTQAINAWANSQLQLAVGSTAYGVSLQKLITPFGVWQLVNDYSLENGVAGGNGFGGVAMSLDLDEITYRYLSENGINCDTKMLLDRVKTGVDGVTDEILGEIGFQIRNEKAHSKLFNVTGYSA